MKYIIFGGGPCGMRLADNLSDKGHEVHLYEKSDSLGGCWKIKWNDGYFTEHSCRVMTTNYKNVIKVFSHGSLCNVAGYIGCYTIFEISEDGFKKLEGPNPNPS